MKRNRRKLKQIIIFKMCIDDYEFRHHSAKREKMCKRFIFQTEDGMERVFLVNISQFQRHGQLCLCSILMHLQKKGLNVKDYKFYMPKFDVAIEAGDECQVPFQVMQSKEIVFEMQRIEDQNMQLFDTIYEERHSLMLDEAEELIESFGQQHQQKQEFSIKQVENENEQFQEKIEDNEVEQSLLQRKEGHRRLKQHQNTVSQALFKTKKWRWIHEKLNLSLKNAAQFVGISKKTLDDYFLVIRVAKMHGYDFKNCLNQKMGHLRAFIKNQPVRIKGRLPKQVSCFDLVADPDLDQVMNIMRNKLNSRSSIDDKSTQGSVRAYKMESIQQEMIAQ